MINSDTFDSKEESYFKLWLDELQEAGLIIAEKYHPKSFSLFEKLEISYPVVKELKTKTKTVLTSSKLLSDHSYQADWRIHWHPALKDIMFYDISDPGRSSKSCPFVANRSEKGGSFFSVIDVKGNYNQNDAWRRFSIDQKWVYQKYQIFVNKCIIVPRISKAGKLIPANALFATTFLPKRLLLTDKTLKERKVNFKYQLIEDYLKRLNAQNKDNSIF